MKSRPVPFIDQRPSRAAHGCALLLLVFCYGFVCGLLAAFVAEVIFG